MNLVQELHSRYGNKRPFRVPEDYFENLVTRLKAKRRNYDRQERIHPSRASLQFLQSFIVAVSVATVVLLSSPAVF